MQLGRIFFCLWLPLGSQLRQISRLNLRYVGPVSRAMCPEDTYLTLIVHRSPSLSLCHCPKPEAKHVTRGAHTSSQSHRKKSFEGNGQVDGNDQTRARGLFQDDEGADSRVRPKYSMAI
ncbi:hypothetical protein OF83DRAFT_246579 [Amylostereum chailletii]|nr:hypothetical protein OF83DRAFT_246579 [Amylostereum chailletii]